MTSRAILYFRGGGGGKGQAEDRRQEGAATTTTASTGKMPVPHSGGVDLRLPGQAALFLLVPLLEGAFDFGAPALRQAVWHCPERVDKLPVWLGSR